ncbi:MAG TPA: hypothetical protein DCP28_08160 [Cytophagales bacterium]|nr:hypothetical protein [Cytophagales bacterium]
MYFFLDKDVLLVEGAKNSALYDLKEGTVYSIVPSIKKLLDALEAGSPVQDFSTLPEVQLILNEFAEKGLGFFSEENNKPAKTKIHPPKPKLDMMWLALNSNCNLVCEHCYATSEPGPCDGTIPMDRLFLAMKEAREVFNVECIQLIGGEPLLLGKNKVQQIIEYAFKLNTPVIEVFTNGHLIDEFYINLFKEKGVHVAISIYSNLEADHDNVTKRKGSWKKTIKAIQTVQSAGIPLRTGIVAMSSNAQSVGDTAPWLKKEFGIEHGEKLYDVVRSCGRGNNKDTIPWDLFLEQHIRVKPDFDLISYESLQKTMYGNVCWASEVCIMPNGDVTPCEMEFEHIQGNITTDNLSEIVLGSGGAMAQRLTKDKIEICKDCEFRYACWECRAMAHQLDANRFSKPLTCMYNPHKGEWNNVPEKVEELFPTINQ